MFLDNQLFYFIHSKITYNKIFILLTDKLKIENLWYQK